MAFKDHDAYFAAADPKIVGRLEEIAARVGACVDDIVPTISYAMPAFRLGKSHKNNRVFFYFAAFKNHIGIYPPLHGPPALVARLAAYAGPKGNLSFPHQEDLPMDLIGEVATALAAQYEAL